MIGGFGVMVGRRYRSSPETNKHPFTERIDHPINHPHPTLSLKKSNRWGTRTAASCTCRWCPPSGRSRRPSPRSIPCARWAIVRMRTYTSLYTPSHAPTHIQSENKSSHHYTHTHQTTTPPTKPKQKQMRALGLIPDFLICRGAHPLGPEAREKLSAMCQVDVYVCARRRNQSNRVVFACRDHG